jgi:predicted transcriptional regulator
MTKGTDQREPGFFIIDNEVIENYDLGPFAGWLYVVIVKHINRQTNKTFPSIATLAEKAGMSKPSVIKYLSELENKNLIRIERSRDPETGEHKPNHYYLVQVVKEIYKGGKGDLQGVVKEVDHNKTKPNNTQLQENETFAPEARGGDLPVAFDKFALWFYKWLKIQPGIETRNPEDRPVEKYNGRDLYFDNLARWIFEVDPKSKVEIGAVAGRVGKIKRWCLGNEIKISKEQTIPGCDLVVMPEDFERFNRYWKGGKTEEKQDNVMPGPAFYPIDDE